MRNIAKGVFLCPALFLRKEERTMAGVYVTLIKGVKTFDQVPAIIQPKVKAVLEALDLGEFAQ